MKKTNLNLTKKRLTIIFTLLVFAIAVLLEWVFFSAKYYNYVNTEKTEFSMNTNDIESKFHSVKDFIINYDIGNRLFKLRKGLSLDLAIHQDEDFVNLLIIDKDKGELIFSNITNDLRVDFVEDILNNSPYSEIEQKSGYFVKKINLLDRGVNYDVLFIKILKYNFSDYLRDLLGFVFITLLFSILFFYIGYKFVSKNLEPVENTLHDMQDFIHNAGHELKTPISIIHSNLQLIKETKKFDKELVNEGLNEITRLNHLIESLVELSNINSSDLREKVDISSEIEAIIKDFKTEASKKKIDISYNKINNKKLTINKQYFYILFSNLLGNAIKYNNEKGKIEIILDKDKLIVKDNGIGIKKENMEKIFDRFFMGEKCRNNDGHGIGLSLVKKISDIYCWKVNVNSEEGKGSEFIIKF